MDILTIAIALLIFAVAVAILVRVLGGVFRIGISILVVVLVVVGIFWLMGNADLGLTALIGGLP